MALLDGEVTPRQYLPDRITRCDVQALLRRVTVQPADDLSRRFPDQMPVRITIWLRDGRRLFREQRAYEGFWSEPMRWETVAVKFDQLSASFADAILRRSIVPAVDNLDTITVADLTHFLAQVPNPVVMAGRAVT